MPLVMHATTFLMSYFTIIKLQMRGSTITKISGGYVMNLVLIIPETSSLKTISLYD